MTVTFGSKSENLPDRLRRMARLVGGEGSLNWAIHVWEDPGFIFISNPICACSTLKLTLNYSVAKAIGNQDFAIASAFDIHNRKANLLRSPRQIGYEKFLSMLDDPGIPVFTFVRSPESRFRSAFRKKLCGENNHTQRVREHLGIGKDVPRKSFLTLDKFAASVLQDPRLRDLDEHWRLQRKQVFYDEIPRLTCGMVETYADDVEWILGGIFGAGRYILKDAAELNRANSSSNRKPDGDALSEAGRACLMKAYRRDRLMIEEIQARRTESHP